MLLACCHVGNWNTVWVIQKARQLCIEQGLLVAGVVNRLCFQVSSRVDCAAFHNYYSPFSELLQLVHQSWGEQTHTHMWRERGNRVMSAWVTVDWRLRCSLMRPASASLALDYLPYSSACDTETRYKFLNSQDGSPAARRAAAAVGRRMWVNLVLAVKRSQ